MAKLLSCVLGPRLYKIYRERDSERTPSGVPEPPTTVTTPSSSSWDTYYQPRALEKHADSILALASVAGPTPSTCSSSLSWKQRIGTSPQKTRGSLPNTTLTLGAGQLTSIGKSPAAGRSPEGALLAGVWPCFAQSPCTGGQQTPSSTREVALLPLTACHCIFPTQYNGRRAKLLACDGNEIDTMFVDRRGTAEPQGQKLVICCEGNAGFYEVGCVSTPLEAGYSVLGWNHPGFAGSTGVPFPQNEANAMDTVVQFAIHRLGFQPQDIVIYAWSIGGFTATWAAMSYPDVSAVILDASFDDLVPLALKVMPDSWRGLVSRTVRQHLNLNNAEQLCRYQGPVLLIRRTKDEIITTTVPEDIMSNRGNDLLLKLLQHRYPRVMAEEGLRVVRQWLEASSQLEEASIYSRWEVEEDWCLSVLRSYQAEHGPDFPWSVGEDMCAEGRRQLALFLARKHLHNFEATHCTPLPAQNFQMAWHL
ncbi:phosphatidylserine lipase ABHD16A isoform 4-T4 [Dugong dugon]